MIALLFWGLAWADTSTKNCTKLLTDANIQLHTTSGDLDAKFSSVTFLRLLDLTLKGIDEAEAAALRQINREELKFQFLQVLADSTNAINPLAELKKIEPDFIVHSTQLVALASIDTFGQFITSLSDNDWSKIRQAISLQITQMQTTKDEKATAKVKTAADFVDIVDANDETQLHRLFRNGQLEEALQVLLNPRIKTRYVNQRSKQKQTALDIFNQIIAGKNSDSFTSIETQLSQALKKKRARTYVKLTDLDEKLLEAIHRDDVKAIKRYFDLGAEVEPPAAFESPLHIAVPLGHLESVKTLVKLGVQVDSRNRLGETPLIRLFTQANLVSLPMAETLIKAGANLEQRDSNGNTVFLLAVASGSTEVIEFLAKIGSNVHATKSGYVNAMHIAIENEEGQKEMLPLLAKLKVDVNHKNSNQDTPLHAAVLRPFAIDSIIYLYELGANLENRNSQQLTPLDLARAVKDDSIVMTLLQLQKFEKIKRRSKVAWQRALDELKRKEGL